MLLQGVPTLITHDRSPHHPLSEAVTLKLKQGVVQMSTVRRRSSIYDARIAGLYDLESTIGRGHYAVVKLARHVFTGEKVAVKVIDKTKLDPVSKSHLMQEVRCMKLVQHPNIVRLYEVIDTQTKLFLILELGDYDMYDFIMKDNFKVSETEAQRYFCQIVEAIDYCHTLKVVHRDLKPENVVFFEKLGMVKLTDFGFSNLFTPGQQLETSCGSLAYSAPEILLGDAYDAPAVDVWSLGVILYMLMVGRLPFQEANDSETLTKILDCNFSLPEHLSDGCTKLISKMLVRDPTKRASLREIVDDMWVRAGDLGHAELLPLICREQVSEEGHEHIIDQMVSGGIAESEEIHRALERDEYSYVTATYYLLAERILKKEREEQASRLIETNTNSDSQLEMASLALSPRIQEKCHRGLTILCTCADPSGFCACVRAKVSHSSGQGKEQVQGLISPVSKTPPTSWQTSEAANGSSSRNGESWRQRTCSMVKEESEEELSSYLKSSRGHSPASSVFGTSPGRGHSSPLPVKELQELCARLGGRTTPEKTGSRSPSPGGSTAGSGRTSPVVSRYKTIGASSMRKLSSSPHLIGICEEREEDGGLLSVAEDGVVGPLLPPATYSSVRRIRPRQAVVSPDVIRRYERVYGSGGRSRRSTSCSSSEASDDDSERRLGLICSRTCRRDGSDHDEDADPPVGGNRGPGRRFGRSKVGISEKNGSNQNGSQGTTAGSTGSNQTRQLDARKLIGKLQKLVLAPIREVPTSFFFSGFFSKKWNNIFASCESEDGNLWYKRLQKPKSCEHLHKIPKNKRSTTGKEEEVEKKGGKTWIDGLATNLVLAHTDEDCNDAEDESTTVDDDIGERASKHKGKRKKHKRCRASALALAGENHLGKVYYVSRPVLG